MQSNHRTLVVESQLTPEGQIYGKERLDAPFFGETMKDFYLTYSMDNGEFNLDDDHF